LNQVTVAMIGAAAGLSIFLGLPIARMRGLSTRAQGFLNALATGVLLFLLWDILSRANLPIDAALAQVHRDPGRWSSLAALLVLFVGGLAGGLVLLTLVNQRLGRRLRREANPGPGAASLAAGSRAAPTARALALMIAIGLGLHNFSEGLAIGQSFAAGALAFSTVLVIGFGLHNITEGFGIAAPLASSEGNPSWSFLALTGLIGGGPTLVGTVVGFNVVAPWSSVLFLALAAGAVIYVINEMLSVCRRMGTPIALSLGLLIGFTAGYATDLLLTYLGG